MKGFILLLVAVLALTSCSTDDDVCTGGEGTPRLKIKFKTEATGKTRTMDSVFVSVDYGGGEVSVVQNRFPTDSVLIPLRVEDVPFTELYIRTAAAGPASVVKINHTTVNEYVSPACGIRKLYQEVTYQLQSPVPVLGTEAAQNQIVNEDKTHLFLLF